MNRTINQDFEQNRLVHCFENCSSDDLLIRDPSKKPTQFWCQVPWFILLFCWALDAGTELAVKPWGGGRKALLQPGKLHSQTSKP